LRHDDETEFCIYDYSILMKPHTIADVVRCLRYTP